MSRLLVLVVLGVLDMQLPNVILVNCNIYFFVNSVSLYLYVATDVVIAIIVVIHLIGFNFAIYVFFMFL